MIGPLQEQDGAWSIRRVLALGCFAQSCVAGVLAILHDSTAGVWVSAFFLLGVLILLGLTTISDLKALAKAARGNDE